MKCRHCDKSIRKSKDSKKRMGLCASCYDWDKKWVKQGLKYSGLDKAK